MKKIFLSILTVILISTTCSAYSFNKPKPTTVNNSHYTSGFEKDGVWIIHNFYEYGALIPKDEIKILINSYFRPTQYCTIINGITTYDITIFSEFTKLYMDGLGEMKIQLKRQTSIFHDEAINLIMDKYFKGDNYKITKGYNDSYTFKKG